MCIQLQQLAAPPVMPKSARPVLKDDVIDFKRLDEAVSTAIESEARYWRENDAKFRAVNQKVATYEEFEGIVKGSHIKPMTEDITALDLKRSSWMDSGRARARDRKRDEMNGMLQEGGEANHHRSNTSTCGGGGDSGDAPAPPKTVQQFLRDWRNIKTKKTLLPKDDDINTARLRYLDLLGAKGIASLFKAEIGHGLLGEFMLVLASTYVPERRKATAAYLEAFGDTGRFALTVEFMTDKERAAAETLLKHLATAQEESRGGGHAEESKEAGEEQAERLAEVKLLGRLKKLYL